MGKAPYAAEYTLPPWLELLRPHNGILAVFAVTIGALVAAGPQGVSEEILGVVVAGLSVFMFMGGGNALNDYYDYETDKVNHPHRPLPSGRMEPDQALWLGRGLIFASVLLGILLNPLALLLVALAAVAMVSYEVHLKERGLVGNLTIAGLSGALFLYGGVAYVNSDGGGGVQATLVLGFLAAVTTLAREIIKDVEDAAGDTDRHTLAHSLGSQTALTLAAILLVGGFVASFLPYILGLFENPGETIYLAMVVVADLVFLVAVQSSFVNPSRSQKQIKVAMFLALLAFLAGAIFN